MEFQGAEAVAVGLSAGAQTQGPGSVAVGSRAGTAAQGGLTGQAVAIGYGAGGTAQNQYCVAIGPGAGGYTQGGTGTDETGGCAIAIGWNAGYTGQSNLTTAIGFGAGNVGQGQGAICCGFQAGGSGQGQYSIAVGSSAGYDTQASFAVAIGADAGELSQGGQGIAIGNQGESSIAIGNGTGATGQQVHAVAIGTGAGGTGQGTFAVALGAYATNSCPTSLAINGTGVPLDAGVTGACFVAPVRSVPQGVPNLGYDTTTSEVYVSAAVPAYATDPTTLFVVQDVYTEGTGTPNIPSVYTPSGTAVVTVTATIQQTDFSTGYMSFQVSNGDTVAVAASDATAFTSGAANLTASATFVVSNLPTAGPNTVTAMYRCGAGPVTISNRTLLVVPL